MSSLPIFIMAVEGALRLLVGLRRTSSTILLGTTCQDSPYLSLSQPHTCDFGSPPGRELVPVVVELLLILDEDLQRDGFVELEDRPAIERGERLPFEFEGHRHDRAFGFCWCVSWPALP